MPSAGHKENITSSREEVWTRRLVRTPGVPNALAIARNGIIEIGRELIEAKTKVAHVQNSG
jgi:hypothetical protein